MLLPDDLRAIDAQVAARGRIESWSRAEDAWLAFGRDVRSYDDDVHEYTNDMSCRSILEAALRAVDPDIAQRLRLRERLVERDAPFLANTRPVEKPIITCEPHEWWWSRVPLEPGEELAAGLRARGID